MEENPMQQEIEKMQENATNETEKRQNGIKQENETNETEKRQNDVKQENATTEAEKKQSGIEQENDVVLKIEHLSKQYKMYMSKKHRLLEAILPKYEKHGTFTALSDFNLELRKGEVLGILGRNGAGKSTLLKMITGVVVPTSGSIEVKGKISSLLELGTAFNPELTGIENIYQHGQVMGLTNEEIEAKKQEIIDFADIKEHIYQPVKTYSSGMFARLAFACAINVDPDILIVDEVLSVGDMAFQLKCFKKFEQFKKAGKTILFVTHSVSDILKNCNRAIILKEGQKIYDGEVKEGVEKYKKIIVGLDEEKSEEEKKEENIQEIKEEEWKKHFNQNPNIEDYGNGLAEVIDYGIFNEKGEYLQNIENDKVVVLKSKVKFKADVQDPIFTMTVKNFNGVEICGTNSMYEKIATGAYKKGEVAIVEFAQKLPLAPNKYTLSFSCTHINASGELEVLNRKYDALLVEVISTKDCVGTYVLDTNMKIEKM